MADAIQPDPVSPPLVVLVVLAIGLCIFSFCAGIVCARLWFYRGALGSNPQKFIIIPRHWRHKSGATKQSGKRKDTTKASQTVGHQRATASSSNQHQDVSNHSQTQRQSQPISNDRGTINKVDLDSPHIVEALVTENNRISRLPAFDQDDCGDGSQFPDTQFTNEPVGRAPRLDRAQEHDSLGITKIKGDQWLSLDTALSEASCRASLLDERHETCVSILPAAKIACEEVLNEVTNFLVDVHPTSFKVRKFFQHKYILCKPSKVEYALDAPFDFHPLETCARLGNFDISIFERDVFTLAWYLTASVTTFPSGWRLAKHMGKSLDAIVNDIDEPVVMWQDFPSIFNFALSTPSTPLKRHSTFIQTHTSSLASALHVTRPADFFAGPAENLHFGLYVRRETQTFRVLPVSQAVVMTTTTELRHLRELNGVEKAALMVEIEGWGEDEAWLKGRDLWYTAVSGWCLGREVVKDDRTVVDVGDMTRVAD